MPDSDYLRGFLGSTVVENLPANAGDVGSISGSVRSPGVGNGNLIQYSCLENSIDRGAWRATVHGVAKSRTQLSGWVRAYAHTHTESYEETSAWKSCLVSELCPCHLCCIGARLLPSCVPLVGSPGFLCLIQGLCGVQSKSLPLLYDVHLHS